MTRRYKALAVALIAACGLVGAWLEITYGDPS
jgi:hypothetical protein